MPKAFMMFNPFLNPCDCAIEYLSEKNAIIGGSDSASGSLITLTGLKKWCENISFIEWCVRNQVIR